MKIGKRLLSLLLCFVMLVGLLPTTALAKSGTGTQQDPVIVSTFAELKEALEEDEDTWIVVNQFNNGSYYTLISGDDYTETSLDQSAYECGAINIPTGKNKHLTINTTIDCRTASTQSGSLLYSFINNRGNLTIDGTGTIAVSFNAGNYANAIIFNQGELNIDAPITLDATCKTVQTFGRAILNHTGTFNISDGTYIGFKSKYLGTSGNVGAIYNSNTDDNVQSVISGGLFETFDEDGRLNLSYALLNEGVDNLTLKGGTFYGIYASQFSLKLSALLGTGCRYTYKNGGGEYDGSDAPETTAALVVENNNLIPTVELTVTTPVAGNNPVSPEVDTFYVTIYAYDWYKGNDKITVSDTFEGGQNYTLKVRANTTKEFPNDVVVKVNGENATVLTVDNNNTSVLFEKSYTVPVSGYTLSFDASGGSGSMAPLTNAMSYTLPDCSFTAPSGKQFAGWNVFGSIYDVGDIVYLSANTTAYAEWEDVQSSGYTLTFDANGGSGSMAPLTGQTSYTLPDCTFTAPSGKQFAGWNVFGYTQEAGDTVNLSSNMTAQAVWENIPQQDQPITAIVISCSGYVVGGNIAEAVPTTSSTGVTIASYEWQDNNGTKLTSGTFAADTQYRLRVFLNVADGYTANSLEKANVKINGTETTYFTNPCTGVDAQYGDMMIYHYPARLTAPTYTVSFAANGGTDTMADATGVSGEYTLPANGFTAPDGQQFKAWAIDSPNGEQKQPNEKITITGDTTIYAIWENIPQQPTTYAVTVTNGTGSGSYAENASVTITANPPENGKQFKEWTGADNLTFTSGSKTTATATFTMPAVAVTVTATYEDIPQQSTTYTVAVSADNVAYGTVAGGGTYNENASVTVTATPNNGYQFVKWTEYGQQVSTNASYTFTANANRTLVAVFEAIPAQPTGHTHNYGQEPNKWDATHHWKECTDQACPDPAGSIKDKAPHTDSDGDGHCDACDVDLIKISFAPGEGTGTMAAVYVTLLPGSVSYDFTLPANGFTAPLGKWFKCWSVGGVEKAVGDKITVTANTTVTAVWAGNTYNPRPNYPIYINPTPGSSSTGQIIAAKTFDGGIGLSVAVTILSAMGGAWLAKKKED